MKRRKKKYKNKKKSNIQEVISNKTRVIQKREHLFKYGIGHVLFFQKRSNIFFVLKTEQNKHVITLTSGSCKVGKTKKQKLSSFNINIIIKRLKEYCKLYNVYRIRFFFRSFISKHYYNIIKYLFIYNIRIMDIGYVLYLPHNKGMRLKKSRRI